MQFITVDAMEASASPQRGDSIGYGGQATTARSQLRTDEASQAIGHRHCTSQFLSHSQGTGTASRDYTILGSERCASGSWAAAADPAFAGRVLPLLLARVRDEDQRERQESVPPVRLRVPVAFLLRVRELVA
jgi:hypothetical protein